MAIMMSAKDVCVDFPTQTVLDDVTLGIDSGDRIGIVGLNGSGKSTLLGVLGGRIDAQAGSVIRSGNVTVGTLAQHDDMDDAATIDAVLDDALARHIREADRGKRGIVEALIGDIDRGMEIGRLSGGQRRRVDLARLLIGDWDILMLDEPTNHLDIDAIAWLADHLKHRWRAGSGALLTVTHDRWFLDEVCTRMWEVHEGKVAAFSGGYSAYVMQRVERERLANLAAEKRNNLLRKELAWLSRGAQARRSKPRFHVEAARELIADVPPVRDPIELKQMATARLGKQVIDVMDVCETRGGRELLRDVTWRIGAGERIGILGRNGAGKSTLLSLLRGELKPTQGHVKIGHSVRFAVLSQHLDELRPFDDDIVRVLLSRYDTTYEVDGRKMTPAALLQRLGFTREQLNTRIGELSGGQRRRLRFLLILLDEPNVLILDEPGNDLDCDMLAVVEDLLDGWPGTMFVVSHDRTFIERVTDDCYAIIGRTIRHLPGGVDEYLRLERADTAAADASAQTEPTPRASADGEPEAAGMSNAERHEARKRLGSLERKMSTRRAAVDAATAALEAADPYDFDALGRCQADVDAARADLAALEDEWLELSDALEDD